MSILDEAREKINAIDEQMAQLFEQRMQTVEDVIRYKREHQMPVLDSAREQAVSVMRKAIVSLSKMSWR